MTTSQADLLPTFQPLPGTLKDFGTIHGIEMSGQCKIQCEEDHDTENRLLAQ